MDGEQALETPRRRDGLHVREIDGETVILDPGSERMHTLNLTAAFVFQAIDGKRTIEQVSAQVADHFDVDPAVAQHDTLEVVRQFRELGLLV